MKRKFTTLLLGLSLFAISKTNAQTTYASINSGYWGATSPYIWETYPTGTPVGAQGTGTAPTSVPSGSHNVYVRSGHAVLTGTPPNTNANRNAFNVTVENGGSLMVGNATPQNLRPGTGASGSMGNVAVVTNNGTFGGPTDGLFIEVGVGATSLTITGTGTTTLSRFRFVNGNLNSASAVIFDQNVTITIADNYAFTATATALANAENLTATINAGKTVTITRGYWNNSGVTGGAAPNGGNYTYNINGILDLSASTTTGSSVFAGSTDATKTTTVNINGTVKLPTSGLSTLNLSEAAATGQQGAVVFNINNGGLLDGNLAPINTTTTTLAPRYFRISGTGQLKRTVAAADVLFDIGVGSSRNPATINNAGTSDNFSVNVKNTIDNTPPTSNVVTKQWTINEDAAGGSNATLKLGWITADQSAGFNPAGGVFIYRYNGSSWEATPATVTGSGTIADPYVATASGFTAFSPFIVGNSSTLPVSFRNAKAYSKSNGIQVEWTTGAESQLSKYVIEFSTDGRSFIQKGNITPGNNSDKNSYAWFDANPVNGANYYRIKSVDIEGKAAYTAILRVTLGKTKADFMLAPNPVVGLQAALQLVELPKGLYSLRVYNTSGQIVYAESISHGGGSSTSTLQFGKNMPTGMYSIELTGGKTRIKKMIVLQ